ncbi:MAG TPA: tetratricopeptide repeat protein [Polyangia bacterium]|nr:tetratricopeptide repeat protein [Polyangia bacterium]
MIHPRSVMVAAAFGSVCALALLAVPAWARDPPAVTKLIQINRKALEDYDNLDWKSAKRRLQDAIAEGKQSGIENHPIMARTYLHLGAVYFEGFKDRDAAILAFLHALQIDPDIHINSAMETPAMGAAFAEARTRLASGGAASDDSAAPEKAAAPEGEARVEPAERKQAPPPPEPTRATGVAALDCPNTDETARGRAVEVKCLVAPNLKVASTILYYRTPGATAFSTVEMKRTPKGAFVGEIPADVTDGKSVQFYVEGRDRSGRPIVANGNSGSPNLMLVTEGGPPEAAPSSAPSAGAAAAREPDENPLEENHIRKAVGRDNRRLPPRKWWIGVGLGSGFGYAKGDGLEVRKDLQSRFGPGLGWAGLGQIAPEFGIHVRPSLAVALQGRAQWIPQSGKDKRGATGATAILARLLFYTAPDNLRFYAGPSVGYGDFRFIFTPDETDPNAKDSVRGGPFLAGVGLGLTYALARSFSFILELNGMAGVPTFSAVADVNAGVQINFF